MFIILEGIDKQGKTSLANHLSKKLGIPIKKFSKPEGDPYIEYMEFLLETKEPMILDRYYLGELAYGPVKRGKAGLNNWQVRNIEMLLLMRAATYYYCYTDEVTTRANFEKDNEDYAMKEDILPLADAFNKAQHLSRLPWLRFDYRKDPKYKEVDRVIDQWWNNVTRHLDTIKSMIESRAVGNFFAKTLVIGDVSNIGIEQARYREVNVPFANGPSAELIYKSIPSIVALSNAKKAHSHELVDLKDELSLPFLEKVICLGNEARKSFELWENNYKISKRINVMKTFHPAYALRGGMTEKEYIQELKTIL